MIKLFGISALLVISSICYSQEGKLKTYSIKQHGVKLFLNSDWIFEKLSEAGYKLTHKCDKERCDNFVMGFFAKSATGPIDKFTQTYLATIPGQFRKHEIHNVADTLMSDNKFKIIDYSGEHEQGYSAGTSLIKAYRDRTVLIQFTVILDQGESYKTHRKLFLNAVSSIEIK